MSEEKEIIRAGCFEGNKTDLNSLCQVPECRLAEKCIWKKNKVPPGLGTDDNKTEAMTKVG